MDNSLFQVLCCVDTTEVGNYRQDCEIREEIRKEMRVTHGYSKHPSCLETVLHDICDTGYFISRCHDDDADDAFEPECPNPVTRGRVLRAATTQPARVIPKFAAAVVVHLRARLGVLARTDANLLLIQRKYLEVCREHGVRDVDVASHLQFVLNAFFTEDVFERVAKTRLRAPRWMRVFEEKERTSTLEVC